MRAMSKETAFHFVNAPAIHRSKRIPEEEWEGLRAEVCRLYLDPTMRLEDVMRVMRETHGFCAR